MSDFRKFKIAVQKQFEKLAQYELFCTDVDKNAVWDIYLNSFPDGTNEIFRERNEYDCQACKRFIRACGNVIAIIDNKKVSIWDINIGDHYQIVADALSYFVKTRLTSNIFLHNEKNLGVDYNRQLLENGDIIKWEHFYFQLPNRFVKKKDDIGGILSNAKSNQSVLKRSLREISLHAAETVLELIEQNSLYRGIEHKSIVELFIQHKRIFDDFTDNYMQDDYCWINSVKLGNASKIRNTAIGTLLVDISDEKELDASVRSFESKVAPTNYKRPTAIITKNMIQKAQEKVAELGIETSLERRYAVLDDITINNVLFANRTVKRAMNVFDELIQETPVKPQNLKKVEEVGIETFIDSILPKADDIEILVENGHINNFVSLIAPKHQKSPNIFKWDNNFSWAYNGNITDSIKNRVKKAGGNVDGVLRCSLSWFNYDDLDIHAVEPNGNHIHYGSKSNQATTGILDVDMNVPANESRKAVENITWHDESRMVDGIYKIYIHNYTPRETIDVGFDVEIEYNNVIHSFHYDKKVTGNVTVAEFDFTRNKGIKFIKSLPSNQASKTAWGLSTQKMHKVKTIMHSPNFWDNQKIGNKHYFFMLDNCENKERARGFFNEFLNEDLKEHRKVFEVLGSKMMTDKSNGQLSGLGFSSTRKNHVFCNIRGSFKRTIKIIF